MMNRGVWYHFTFSVSIWSQLSLISATGLIKKVSVTVTPRVSFKR